MWPYLPMRDTSQMPGRNQSAYASQQTSETQPQRASQLTVRSDTMAIKASYIIRSRGQDVHVDNDMPDGKSFAFATGKDEYVVTAHTNLTLNDHMDIVDATIDAEGEE